MLWVTRHIPTLANLEHICQGWEDSRILSAQESGWLFLNEIERQSIDVKKIVSSDLPRAQATATILAKILKVHDVRHDRRIREMSYGVFENRPYADIRLFQPTLFDEQGFFKYDERLTGGESLSKLRARVISFYDDISRDSCPTMIVGHGGSIRMLYSVGFNLEYNFVHKNLPLCDGKILPFSADVFTETTLNNA